MIFDCPWIKYLLAVILYYCTLLCTCRFGDLRLVTSSALDRERVDRYRMAVVAYDGGDPVKTGSLKVTVKVMDSNDNVPVFERASYEFTVTEDQPPGSVVGKVKISTLLKFYFCSNNTYYYCIVLLLLFINNNNNNNWRRRLTASADQSRTR